MLKQTFVVTVVFIMVFDVPEAELVDFVSVLLDDTLPELETDARLCDCAPIEIPIISGMLSETFAEEDVLHSTEPDSDAHLIFEPAAAPILVIVERLVLTTRYRCPFATMTTGVFAVLTETDT